MFHKSKFLCLIFVIIQLSVSFLDSVAAAASESSSYCDGTGWETFSDEKCFKLIAKWATRDDAVRMCQDETLPTDAYPPVLIQIKSIEELNYLIKYIFQTSNARNSVWIGAKRLEDDHFEWDDGTGLDFANWATNFPTQQAGRDCVEMQSNFTKLDSIEGKWRDVTCDAGNFVVCQKLPRWSSGKLQQTLLETRKLIHENQNEIAIAKSQLANTQTQLENTENQLTNTQNQLAITQTQLSNTQSQLANNQNQLTSVQIQLSNTQGQLSSTQTQLTNTKSEVENLRKNPVPIGFIYVQLANQPEPKTIWPTVSWTEVSSQYAGLFFRGVGGNSASFGSTQEGASPRLTSVENIWESDSFTNMGTISLTLGQWTTYLRTGGSGDKKHHGVRFLMSNSEVRPRNQAVRIWRRSN